MDGEVLHFIAIKGEMELEFTKNEKKKQNKKSKGNLNLSYNQSHIFILDPKPLDTLIVDNKSTKSFLQNINSSFSHKNADPNRACWVSSEADEVTTGIRRVPQGQDQLGRPRSGAERSSTGLHQAVGGNWRGDCDRRGTTKSKLRGQSEQAPMTAPVGHSIHRNDWMICLFFICFFTLR